jgi:multiple sugar transport system permease protein
MIRELQSANREIRRPTSGRKSILGTGLARHEAMDGLLMVSPWIFYFIVFVGGPMVASFIIAMYNWDLLSPARFIGLGNFQHMANDEVALISVGNSAYYTLIAVPLQLVVALLMALLMNTRTRGVAVYRAIFFVPMIFPPVAIAFVWMWLLQPDFGLVNNTLSFFGLPTSKWLYDPNLAKLILIAINTWQFGQTMVIFLAGLREIPQVYYEAARIDGAGTLDTFRHITLPLLSPMIFFNLVLQTIWSFQGFTYAYVMTQGGPGNATLFSVLYVWRNGFQYFSMGYASALAVVLFLIIMAITLVLFWSSRFWVHYEAEVTS